MNGTATQSGANRYDRVGRLIHGIQRMGGSEGLRGLKTNPGVAPDTAERGAILADRYDTLLARCERNLDGVGADEIGSLLRDAAALFEEMTRKG